MLKANIYEKCNRITRESVNALMKKYFKFENWWKNDHHYKMLDVGCGDLGVLQDIVIPKIPVQNFSFVGTDLSKDMLQRARHNLQNDVIKNLVHADAENPNFSSKFQEKFDLIFAIFSFHWINNQQQGYDNLFSTLKSNGKIFLTYVPYAPLFDIYHRMENDKTNPFCNDFKNSKKMLGPYHNQKNEDYIVKDIKRLLSKSGFSEPFVKIEKLNCQHVSLDDLFLWMVSINPYLTVFEKNKHNLFLQKVFAEFLQFDDLKLEFCEKTFAVKVHHSFDVVVVSASKN